MKKLIFTTFINFLLIFSVFATQLPTDFLATQNNVQTEEDVTYMPIYMTMFMKKRAYSEPVIYTVDVSNLS